MRALYIDRSVPRLGAARIAAGWSAAAAVRIGPLEYGEIDDPELHGPGWHRVHTRLTGICGSDLSMIEGHASTYFDDWVSFPFVPGHEVVGQLDDGTRVVIEPVLGHEARGFRPPFDGAAPGDGDDYAHLATGPLEPGIQTGFCCSTGGGWAPWFVAHESQLHRIADDMPDERAVLVEPVAGGVHAALLAVPTLQQRADENRPAIVAVIGAGTMGLTTIAGLRRYVPDAHIIVGARHPHQKRLARDFGADVVVEPDALPRAVRRAAGCHVIGDYLSSGAHVTIDAVGTSATLTEAMHITRPRGRVIMLGMPADVTVDLTGLWHRETELKGAYTYGTELLSDGSTRRTFDLAIETANELRVEQMLSATYPLADHVDAIAHAADAGRRGATKVAFEVGEGI